MNKSRLSGGVMGSVSVGLVAPIVAMMCLGSVPRAHAQADGPERTPAKAFQPAAPSARAPKRVSPIIRRPLIDLEALAKARRDGQIMPGDPAPGSSAVLDLPVTERPVEPAPQPVPIKRVPPAPERAREPVPVQAPSPPPPAPVDAPPAPPPAPKAPAAGDPTAEPLPELPPAKAPPLPPAAATPAKPETTLAANAPAIATDIPARRIEPAPQVVPAAGIAESPAAEAPAIEPAPRDLLTEERRSAEVVRVSPPSPVAASASEEPPAVTVLGPARVRIARTSGAGGVEWRHSDAPWSPVATGASAEGRVELRAAMDADTTVIVEDRLEVRVGRLARAIIETAAEGDGTKTVHIGLARGAIEVRPVGGAPGAGWSRWVARVRTPDRSVALVVASSIEYDAFAGAKVRLLGDAP